MVGVAMGGGNSGIGEAPTPAVMPGTMRKGTCLGQGLAFLAAAPNMKGSPPLRRKTRFSGARQFNEPEGDVLLHRRGLAAALPAYSSATPDFTQRKCSGFTQSVIDHHVAGLHGVVAEERHEAGAPGPAPPARPKPASKTGKASRQGGQIRCLRKYPQAVAARFCWFAAHSSLYSDRMRIEKPKAS